jgi:anti-sigma B factor antagonist
LGDINSYFNEFNEAKTGMRISGSVIENRVRTMVILLDGSLDTHNSTHFADILTKTIDNYGKAENMVIDLGKLTYISSTGIGSFHMIFTHLKQKNIELYFMNINDKVNSVLHLLGFSGFFNIINSLQEINGDKILDREVRRCPFCAKLLRISNPGKFRCPSCKNLITVTEDGTVSKG